MVIFIPQNIWENNWVVEILAATKLVDSTFLGSVTHYCSFWYVLIWIVIITHLICMYMYACNTFTLQIKGLSYMIGLCNTWTLDWTMDSKLCEITETVISALSIISIILPIKLYFWRRMCMFKYWRTYYVSASWEVFLLSYSEVLIV